MKVKDYVLDEALGQSVTKANRELNLTLFRNFKNVKIEITPEQWGVMVHLWKKRWNYPARIRRSKGQR